jgi:hypothetical protein
MSIVFSSIRCAMEVLCAEAMAVGDRRCAISISSLASRVKLLRASGLRPAVVFGVCSNLLETFCWRGGVRGGACCGASCAVWLEAGSRSARCPFSRKTPSPECPVVALSSPEPYAP